MAQEFAGVYVRRDRPGRFWTVGYHPCCRERLRQGGTACAACQSCLIYVGALHHEQRGGPFPLPILTDQFDEDDGRWYRGIYWLDRHCCESCIEDLGSERFQPTLRIAPVPAADREARVQTWAAERGIPLPGRMHVGGFLRLKEEDE